MKLNERYIHYLRMARPGTEVERVSTMKDRLWVIDGEFNDTGTEIIHPDLPRIRDSLNLGETGIKEIRTEPNLEAVGREVLCFEGIIIRAKMPGEEEESIPIPAAEMTLAVNKNGGRFVLLDDGVHKCVITINTIEDAEIFDEVKVLWSYVDQKLTNAEEMEEEWSEDQDNEDIVPSNEEDDQVEEGEDDGWVKMEDESGNTAYYNRLTGDYTVGVDLEADGYTVVDSNYSDLVRSENWMPGRIARLIEAGVDMAAACDYEMGAEDRRCRIDLKSTRPLLG